MEEQFKREGVGEIGDMFKLSPEDIEKVIKGLNDFSEKVPDTEKSKNGINRRGFLKTAGLVIGTVAITKIGGGLAEGDEKRIEREPLTECEKFTETIQTCFRIPAGYVDTADFGEGGIGVVYKFIKSKNEKDLPEILRAGNPIGIRRMPKGEMAAFNKKLEPMASYIRGTAARIKSEMDKSPQLGDFAFQSFLIEQLAYINKVQNFIDRYLQEKGEELLTEKESSLDEIREQSRGISDRKLSAQIVKLNDGRYGYKTQSDSGKVKYYIFRPLTEDEKKRETERSMGNFLESIKK